MAQATQTKPDLSAFYALSRPKKAPCQIGVILSGEITPELSKGEREQLTAALASDKNIITGAAIVEWLKERGHVVNSNRVSNHRRGVCACD